MTMDPVDLLLLFMYKKSPPITSFKNTVASENKIAESKIHLYTTKKFSAMEALLTIEGRKIAIKMFEELRGPYYNSSLNSYAVEWNFSVHVFFFAFKRRLDQQHVLFEVNSAGAIEMKVETTDKKERPLSHVLLYDSKLNLSEQSEVSAWLLTKKLIGITWKETKRRILIQSSKENDSIEELKCQSFEKLWKSNIHEATLKALFRMFWKKFESEDTELDLDANWYRPSTRLKIQFQRFTKRPLPVGVVYFRGKNVMEFKCDEKSIQENMGKITKWDMQDWVVFGYLRDFISSSIEKLTSLMKNGKYRTAPNWKSPYNREHVVVWANEDKNNFFVSDWPNESTQNSFDGMVELKNTHHQWAAYRGLVIK